MNMGIWWDTIPAINIDPDYCPICQSQISKVVLKNPTHGRVGMIVGKLVWCCLYILLVVSTNPPEKWWSSSDWIIIPTIGKNKIHVPNHQPVYLYIYISLFQSLLLMIESFIPTGYLRICLFSMDLESASIPILFFYPHP